MLKMWEPIIAASYINSNDGRHAHNTCIPKTIRSVVKDHLDIFCHYITLSGRLISLSVTLYLLVRREKLIFSTVVMKVRYMQMGTRNHRGMIRNPMYHIGLL
jgi:hypothetical protein